MPEICEAAPLHTVRSEAKTEEEKSTTKENSHIWQERVPVLLVMRHPGIREPLEPLPGALSATTL